MRDIPGMLDMEAVAVSPCDLFIGIDFMSIASSVLCAFDGRDARISVYDGSVWMSR